jgi:hypothetical protein
MPRGVVSVPHGYGHGRAGIGWDVPDEAKGESYNDLVPHTRVDITGNAALNGIPIEIRATPNR